jgi:hypothetical protein
MASVSIARWRRRHFVGAGVRATRIWGVCCFVGEVGDVTINVSPDMIRRQMTIIASWTFLTVGQADCAKFPR